MKTITAELLTIGDEILFGQIVDTNSQWMSVELANAGIKVIRKTSVGDIESEILTAFAEAETRADIILITGGLGPTNDDLTKPCLAKYFNCEMAIHEEALAEVTAFFKSRGRELTEINRLQASLPVCCEKITNSMGTAPGMWFEKNGKVFVSMPGVPHEMKRMMTDIVIPKLKAAFQTPEILHTVIRTVGIGESFLADKISSWENALPEHIRLAYLPSLGEVKLRLTAIGNDKTSMQREAEELVENLKLLAGDYIFNIGEDSLEVVLGKTLAQKKLTVSAAESCTGGYLSHLLTSVPGSSSYFKGGVIAYANEIKTNNLGIDPAILKSFGAVSEEAVSALAKKVREQFETDIGVATSGVAGPGGGTAEKPVGTVWIAYSDEHQTITRRLQLSKDRLINIRMSSIAVLNLVRTSLPD
ncbi:MAG TPA: competence/damage-inducible protein A [Chryseosolibacter sp.]|nr:competence/damage-inducible protein A [Chryseosolibacter sp.]